MTSPTPEQIRLYRHRTKVVTAVQICAVPVAPIVGGLFLSIRTQNTDIAGALAFGGFMLVVIGIFVFRHFYYRCPVCSHSLGRGPKYIKVGEFFKGHCNHCEADYAA
jgi:hypothetical protein